MNVTGVGSIVLNVSDREASKRFYGEQLGLGFEMESPDGHVAVYSAGSTAIVLHSVAPGNDPAPAGPEDPGTIVLMLSVDDVDAAAEELRAKGVTITDGPADQPWGERVLELLDPDGYSINLTQPLPERA